jgi:hypothetical protein
LLLLPLIRQLPRTPKVGDTFYEPTGCLRCVSRNPSKEGKTRILSVVLHPAAFFVLSIRAAGQRAIRVQ